jgi:hypothetical protein
VLVTFIDAGDGGKQEAHIMLADPGLTVTVVSI